MWKLSGAGYGSYEHTIFRGRAIHQWSGQLSATLSKLLTLRMEFVRPNEKRSTTIERRFGFLKSLGSKKKSFGSRKMNRYWGLQGR